MCAIYFFFFFAVDVFTQIIFPKNCEYFPSVSLSSSIWSLSVINHCAYVLRFLCFGPILHFVHDYSFLPSIHINILSVPTHCVGKFSFLVSVSASLFFRCCYYCSFQILLAVFFFVGYATKAFFPSVFFCRSTFSYHHFFCIANKWIFFSAEYLDFYFPMLFARILFAFIC